MYPQAGAFVLENQTPDDVAHAIIEGGRQKEPFYILDLDDAYRRINHFREIMPRVQIFYAIKAHDSDMFLKLTVALGTGFDCATPGEIDKILKLKVNPQSIIYAMPTKTPEQMMFAREVGVKHTTFDTSYELKKIKYYWPEARLLIRIRVDGESIYRLGDKFGCDFETEAVALLEEAACLGLKVVGVAFHVGSACSSWNSHVVGLQQAKALFDHERHNGREMTIVDIGGGFLSERIDSIDEQVDDPHYTNIEVTSNAIGMQAMQVGKLINKTLEELFPDPNVLVIAEPGRYLCDSSANLYCNICNIRRITKDDKTVTMIYINDGIYGTLRIPEPWHVITKFQRSSEKDTGVLEDVILWGPSCDSTDRVMPDSKIRLPPCTVLDWLVFTLQGAYTVVFSSRFSCLEIPLIRPVISSNLWNQVKDSTVYNEEDFILNPDISTPLPSTLPRVLKNGLYEHKQIPTLNM